MREDRECERDLMLRRNGDLVARLRFMIETDRDAAVLFLADAVGRDVLDAALANAVDPRPGSRAPGL